MMTTNSEGVYASASPLRKTRESSPQPKHDGDRVFSVHKVRAKPNLGYYVATTRRTMQVEKT